MRKALLSMLAAAALVGGAPTNVYGEAVAATRGVVRVKLQPEVAQTVARAPRLNAPGGQVTSGVESLDNALNLISGVSIRPMLPPNPKFAEQRAKYGLDQWYIVNFDERLAPESVLESLADVAGVMNAEVVKPMELKEGNGAFHSATTAAAKAPATYPFNDPRLPEQWHYKNFGTKGQQVAGADINLFDAWQIATGNKDVVVAVIDGGIDYTHEDLAANMYVNTAELNGTEGVDDDDNGYIDDIYGFNFCTMSGEVYPHSHGTHVAGTVAAVNNNGIGVAGVAGGNGTKDSGVKLLSCQVFDSRQGSGDGNFAEAIIYAAEKGATIAQCSWGWADEGYYEMAVLEAIRYFTDLARNDKMTGGLMIFAAGNEGATGNYYPACMPEVVSVAAMSNDLRPASYSCFGEWVDLIAPGGLLDYGQSEGILSTLPNNDYGFNEGTSMATPHVSGIAALVLSKYGSPSFTNEILRTQLITSVNDFYGYNDGINEKFRGEYGAGYIDAYKALQMGDGTAPAAVGDFTLQAAQDYIVVNWTIPESSDNNVHSHIIYYSTEPFTADDLSKTKTVIADTKFANSGDTFSQQISGLSPLTKYYVAITAVNRWGTAAAMSPVKEIQTNEGPKMTLNVSDLTLRSTADAPISEASFVIGNEAEGILNWTASKAMKSVSLSTYSRKPVNPTPGRMASTFSGKIQGLANTSKSAGTVASDYIASEYPKTLKYYDTYYAVIGDSDTSLPNSMAQLFWVDPEVYPQGFNLTALTVDYTYGKNPVIEIYRGPTPISSATLLQRVEYSYFVSNYNIALNEQIHFGANESFWIVVHFEGNQSSWPLPVALYSKDYSYVSTYSFMSNDLGKTWVPLKKALEGSLYEPDGDKLTWGIVAKSTNPNFSELLTLNPVKGTVLPNGTQTVNASIDGSQLVNGSYKFNVNLSTNETDNNNVTIPVSYNVSGNKADIQVPKVVDFGSLLVGESKTLSVEVFNKGYGTYSGSKLAASIYSNNISSTSSHFHGPSYISSGLPARSYTKFDVTYTPTSAGSHSGAIILKNSEKEEVRIIVRGVATDPAKLSVEPAVVEADTLDINDEPKVVSFTVANDGNYPLEYVFPKFSDETIENQKSRLHQFGYGVTSNIAQYNDGFAYSAPEPLVNAVDVRPQMNDNVYLSSPVSMGFEFPFYGKNYDKVYITSLGFICFAPNAETLRGPITPVSESILGSGVISAYGRELRFGANSKIECAKQDGKFIVNYSNVLGLVYADQSKPISFRIVLSANGDIEIFYDDYNSYELFQEGSTLYCGIADPELKDAYSVTDADIADYLCIEERTEQNHRYERFVSGTAVKFTAPKTLFVRNLDKPYGLINPGESVEIKATVAADETLDAGTTYNDLAIVTNDPHPVVSAVRINATITGAAYVADAALELDTINLGDVFRTASVKTPVTIKNNGHNTLTVTSVTLNGEDLTLNDVTVPFTLDPRTAKDLFVTINTQESKAVEGTVVIATTDGELTATVKANVIGCPDVELSLDYVYEEVNSGDELHKDLVITNPGDETLVYSVAPNDIVKLAFNETSNRSISYKYEYSEDDNNVEFDWVDIVSNGLGTQTSNSYYKLFDYTTVELPFEFPFYGKTYNTIYIYNTGFISFTQRHDDNIWPEPPVEFPGGTIYTNIIAPYWGLHSPNQTNTAGTYHYITEDRAVISFMEYGNSMNYDVCYQVILEKDGSFKFQYYPYSYSAIIQNAYGLAGVSNENGSKGFTIPANMIKFNTATQFTPVSEATLEPGASETIGLDFNTKRMGGDFEAPITFTTNVPAKENVVLPVNVSILGVADPVWPEDSIYVEHPIGYYDYNDPAMNLYAAYSAQFTIGNKGTADFYIAAIEFECETIYDDYFEEYTPAFGLFYYDKNANGGFGGEPLATLSEFDGQGSWRPLYEGEGILVGADGAKFMVPMFTESEAYFVPGTHEMLARIYSFADADAIEPDIHEIKITMVVTPIPAIALDKEEIYTTAENDESIITESLNIINVGEYKLTYTLTLDPTGVGESEDPGFGDPGIAWAPKKAPANTAKLAEIAQIQNAKLKTKASTYDETAVSAYDLPLNFEFNDALYYPHSIGSQAIIYTYGSQSLYGEFIATTTYTAPADGFNISHLYTAVNSNCVPNYEVKFEIIQGSDPEGENVIGTASLVIESQDTPEVGQFFVVALDKPVYLSPGEEFTIVATYAAGSPYPAYLVAKEEQVISNRYQGWVESYGWFDIATLFKDTYGSIGYIMTCLETKEGQPWIRLITPENGVVEVGEMNEIKLEMNAAAARMEKGNTAMLVIKSNDPAMPLINFPIILDCNGKPVIKVTSSVISAKENSTVTVPVTVSDPEGDEITFEIYDNLGITKVESWTVSEGDDAVVTANEDSTYTVTGATMPVTFNVAITPEYGTASTGNSFVVLVTDNNGHEATARVRYDIEFVNRAPEAVETTEIKVKKGEISAITSFESLFTEPDGDALTYTLNVADTEIVEAYTTNTGVIFCGLTVGTTTATVTATDAMGASTDNVLTIVVDDASGIDSVTAANGTLTVMPNPVEDWLNAHCDFAANDVTFTLYGVNGAIVARQTADVTNGDTVQMNVAALAAGNYILTAEFDGTTLVARVVKR